jgi:hypothetical protein
LASILKSRCTRISRASDHCIGLNRASKQALELPLSDRGLEILEILNDIFDSLEIQNRDSSSDESVSALAAV